MKPTITLPSNEPITRSFIFTLLAFCCVPFLFCSTTFAQNENENDGNLLGDVARGQKLFEKVWKVQPSIHVNDPDGLGPLFNSRSCVGCHNQAGTGGAGDNSSNVQLLSVLPRKLGNGKFDLKANSIEQMFKNAEELHPQLAQTNAVVWHRHSTNDDYDSWRRDMLDFKKKRGWSELEHTGFFLARQEEIRKSVPVLRVNKGKRKSRFTLQVSHRNTPSLFGTGLIEQIKEEDIREIARRQANSKSRVKGLVADLPDGTVGRFGWRGQESSLTNFTLQACAVELGLGNTIKEQLESPIKVVLNAEQKQRLARAKERRERFELENADRDAVRRHDVSESEIRDMVAYIAKLPAPGRQKLFGNEAEHAHTGLSLFNNIGCAECHVQTVGHIDGVYSDFLMHDMGKDLADVAGVINRRNAQLTIGGYFGSSTPVGPALTVGNDRLWQTPPLWGIANSAPYLHDGRAKNLHEAIILHGGESFDSRENYRSLSKTRKQKLLKFLSTLGDAQP